MSYKYRIFPQIAGIFSVCETKRALSTSVACVEWRFILILVFLAV